MKLICIHTPKGQVNFKAPDLVVGKSYTSIVQKTAKEIWAEMPIWARNVVKLPEGMFHKLLEQGPYYYHETCFIDETSEEDKDLNIEAITTKMIEL